MIPARPGWLDSAWRVAGIYLAVTLATTWPLATRLTTSLPADLGDPVLNSFILQWGMDHIGAFAGGDLGAFVSYWHAPIFHPEPLALAYSEHLFAQALQGWPIYAVTGNVLLAYNVLFVSTFVLSAVGMYLLARELTGSPVSGFVAGLLYGFALCRVAQHPHLQALSSQWLPFALYGLRRFFTTRRLRPLAGATLALVAQNLSNGYYLIFFAPFVAAYCLFEIADRRLWADRRVVGGLLAAAVATAVATAPFLVPYLIVRGLGFEPRAAAEVRGYSADLLSWVTAAPASRLWGWLQTFSKGEGELFAGVATLLLAGTGVAARTGTIWRAAPAPALWRRASAAVLGALIVAVAGFAALVLATNDPYWRVLGVRLTLRAPYKAALVLAALVAALAVVSPRARRLARGIPGSALGFFAAGAMASAWLTLGPVVEIGGVATRLPAPYAWLYAHVPGFDGLRVPARYAMLTACCLAVLGGFGARALLSRGRAGARLVVALTALFLIESTSAPMALDQRVNSTVYENGPRQVLVGGDAPAVYRFIAALPASSVIVEFPFGSPAWDLQAVFYQRVHRHPIVNGYSGWFPRSFDDNREAFAALSTVPEVAWRRLLATGATHVLVHEAAFRPGRGGEVERWLTAHGATLLAVHGSDRVFDVRP